MTTKKNETTAVHPVEKRELEALLIRVKQIRGEKLFAKEQAILNRWQREQSKAIVDSYVRAIPKGIYCQMAGRQQKIIDEFGSRYDVPLIGETIDLYITIKTLHERISELAAAARPYQDVNDAELQREKLRQEIQKLQRQSEVLKIDIQTRMAELVPKAMVTERLEWLSGRLQALGSRLHRVGGEDSQAALNEFLEEMAVELDGGSLAI